MDQLLWVFALSGAMRMAPSPIVRQDTVPSDTGTPLAAAGGGLALPPVSFLRAEPPMVGAAPQRPRAIEYSDFYYTRLAIHRIASWAALPLFGAEYFLGQKLYSNPPGSRATLQWHQGVALGVAGLFGINTVTGVWNLWDSRKDPAGRARRYIHSALMLAADAGFVAVGATAPSPRRIRLGETSNVGIHRGLAIASMGTALASWVMMLVWK